MVKKWKDKKMCEKRYFVLDKRGLHYFKDSKDVTFDGTGVVDIAQADGLWECHNIRIAPADLTASEFEAEVTERQGTALVERELILKMETAEPRALFDELDKNRSGSLDHGTGLLVCLHLAPCCLLPIAILSTRGLIRKLLRSVR